MMATMLNCVEISVGISTDVETEKVASFMKSLDINVTQLD